MAPKAIAATSFATPAHGHCASMTTPEERERESANSTEDKFTEMDEEQRREQDAAAERLRQDELPEPDEN